MRVYELLMKFEFGVFTFAASQAVGRDYFNPVAATTSSTTTFVVTHDIAADMLFVEGKEQYGSCG